ncbi:AAA family ATPase [Micromonospora sp. NPDC047793]|uniref:AAA family ATPase n=1 Tax=Micromonospora sp. NPDC047793 TaxID=3154342 RepID=UPI0033D51B48
MYDPAGFTITTPAIEEAARAVATYLSGRGTRSGRVLAVTGEHGMGKTYLAQHVLNQARETADRNVRTMYLLARNQTFVELYQDFADQLLKQSGTEVLDLVRKVYAAIVADSLRGSELTERIANDLDAGALDPVAVVKRYGLAQSDFLQSLQGLLQKVTSQTEFSIALTLLLRPEFEASVREWLLGHAPDPLLRERGVEQTIDTEQLALQAMGVFTLLYGHVGIPFLLVIDEIEQILLRRDRPSADVIASFQQFLEIFGRAGGFLLLAGVPESVESFKAGVKQRIGEPVRMRPFTAEDVSAVITRNRPDAAGAAALAPFTQTTVDYLVALVGGVARTVVRMGYRLYRDAVAKGVDVTPAMVREAVRGEYDVSVTATVHREIESVLSASGWPYAIDRRIGQPGVAVDYYAEVREDAHCAIMIIDFVLSEDIASRIGERVQVLRREPGDVAVILVVTGLLSAELTAGLTNSVGSRPLQVELSEFGDEFSAAFKSAVDRLLPARPADTDARPWLSDLDRVVRQQSNIYRLLGQTSTRVEGFRAHTDRQFAEIVELLRALQAGPSQTSPAAASLPDDIKAMFDDADAALFRLAEVDTLFAEALRVEGPAAAEGPRMDRLDAAEVLQAAGAGFLLERLLGAFRRAVATWYEQAISREPDVQLWERLEIACRRFDTICETVPGLAVEQLVWLTEPVAVARLGRRRRTVPEGLEGLGNRIRVTLGRRFDRPVG